MAINACEAIDYAKQNNFKLEIIDPTNPDAKLFNFLIQDTSIPGLTLASGLTKYQNINHNIQNNVLEYEPITINIMLDSDWKSYFYIHDWMVMLQKSDSVWDQMRNINIFLEDNNKYPIKQINLFKAWPTSMSSIPVSYANIDTSPVLCSITFAYQWYTLDKII